MQVSPHASAQQSTVHRLPRRGPRTPPPKNRWRRLRGSGDVLDGEAPESDDTPDEVRAQSAATHAARPPSHNRRGSPPPARAYPRGSARRGRSRPAVRNAASIPTRIGSRQSAQVRSERAPPAAASSAATASNAWGSYGNPCRSRTGQPPPGPAVSIPTSSGRLRTESRVKVTTVALGQSDAGTASVFRSSFGPQLWRRARVPDAWRLWCVSLLPGG
jgi:hypothetical protein